MRLITTGLLIALLATGPAAAGVAEDLRDCNGQDWQRAFEGCSRLISGGYYRNQPAALSAVYQNRAISNLNRNFIEDAITDFGEAIRLKPDNIAALGGRAHAYFETGRFDEAATDYQAIIRITPRDTSVLLRLGRAYAAKRDFDLAIGQFNLVLEIKPDDADALLGRGRSHSDKGQSDRAITDLARYVALRPNDVLGQLLLGVAHSQAEDYDRAIATFDVAILLKPEEYDSYLLRGAAYYHKGDYDRAIADFRRGIDANRTDVRLGRGFGKESSKALYLLGTALAAKGEHEEAMTVLEDALQKEPRNADVYVTMGATLYQLGRFEEAIKRLREAIRIDPNLTYGQTPYAHMYLGNVLAHAGDLDGAFTALDTAVRLRPRDPLPLVFRALAVAFSGDTERALSDNQAALRLNPRSGPAHGGIAKTHLLRGERDKALASFAEAIRINPTDVHAYANRARLYWKAGDLASARADAERSVALAPKLWLAHMTRGVVNVLHGDNERGIADLSQAIRLNPVFVEPYLFRARAYQATGRTDLARADYRRALDPKLAAPDPDNKEAREEARRRLAGLDVVAIVVPTPPAATPPPVPPPASPPRASPPAAQTPRVALPEPPRAAVPPETPRVAPPPIQPPRVATPEPPRGTVPPTPETPRTTPPPVQPEPPAEPPRIAGPRADPRTPTPSPPPSAEAPPRAPPPAVPPPATPPPAANPPAPVQPEPRIAITEPTLPAGASALAYPERRVALVIGNRHPDDAMTRRAAADARLIADRLLRLGFTVVEGFDLDRASLERAITTFAGRAQAADWSLVYFTGYGMSAGRVNYLLPADARMGTPADVTRNGVPLERLLNAAAAAPRLRLVVLDTPGAPGMAERLARADARTSIAPISGLERVADMLVLTSMGSGSPERDDGAPTSLLARSFASHLEARGLEVRHLIASVAEGVARASRARQGPQIHGRLAEEPPLARGTRRLTGTLLRMVGLPTSPVFNGVLGRQDYVLNR